MLEKLSIGKLQKLIGAEVLDRITEIIPSLPDSGIRNPQEIYDNKRTLIKIFESFNGYDRMYERDFRKLVYGSLSNADITSLCEMTNLPADGDFQTKIDRLLSLSWGNNEQTKTIMKVLDIPDIFLPPERVIVPGIEEIRRPDAPFKSLLDFQMDVYNSAISELENPYSRFIIQMPTGSGKTRTAMEIVAHEFNNHPDRSIVWLAHSEELCEQAVDCFKEVWEHIGEFDIDVMRVWGNNSLQELQRTTFVVAGLQKLYSVIWKPKSNRDLIENLSNNISLIIFDEAHKAIAPTYQKVLKTLSSKYNNVRIIGLTATPGRGYINSDTTETQKLLEYFNNKIIEIDSGDYTVFEFLRRRKILATMERDSLVTDILVRLSDKELKSIEKFWDYPEGFLKRLANDDNRNREIIQKLKSECDAKRKIIFFANSIDHSKFICALLVFLGFKAEHIDGSTKRERRADIISNFKEGKLDVICNYGVLTTGFDAPKIDVVFISRPTLSIVLYSQMIGRGLRGPAIGGTETCKIIDVVDNIENYDNPDICYEYFKSYSEEV